MNSIVLPASLKIKGKRKDMEMPYKDLKSKNLSSLVNVIKVVTVISYIILAISLVIVVFANVGLIPVTGALMLPYAILGLLLSGFLAILVSLEETFRLKVTNSIQTKESDL